MSTEGPTPAAVSLTFASTLLALLTTAGYVAIQSMPANPMRDLGDTGVVRWLPQGWGFFTKSAQEPSRAAYRRAHGGWAPLNWRRSQIALGWGLDRSPAREMIELNTVLDGVWEAVAKDCDGDPLACADRYQDVVEVDNAAPTPRICGEIAVVEQAPVPWAWREFEDFHMPSTVAVVRVSC